MSQSEFYEKIGRQLVSRAGEETEKFEGRFGAIGRTIVRGGGLPSASVEAYRTVDEGIAENEILPRIDDELIEEHARNPIGQHSDDLQRVLHYFRRQPTSGKYVIVETVRNERWCVSTLSGDRNVPVEISEECYGSPEEAEHAVFEKRVSDLRDRLEGSEDD